MKNENKNVTFTNNVFFFFFCFFFFFYRNGLNGQRHL